MFRPDELLDLGRCPCPELFRDVEQVWEVLKRLPEYVRKSVRPQDQGARRGQPHVGEQVSIGAGTMIEHGTVILGPAIIGRNCQIRAGAYVRENVVVGDDCVLGHDCEFKNAILLDGATVPHFSYVGDSILGWRAHLGAGVILSNVKSTGGHVTVSAGGALDTGLHKFGAIIGDGAEIGCNCVLNPGSIIGRRAILYPNVLWRGVCPADSIVKLRQEHLVVTRRER